MDSDSMSTIGVGVLAAGAGGASGNWWLSAVIIGLAMIAGAYAKHVTEQDDPVPDEQGQDDGAVPPATARVDADRRVAS